MTKNIVIDRLFADISADGWLIFSVWPKEKFSTLVVLPKDGSNKFSFDVTVSEETAKVIISIECYQSRTKPKIFIINSERTYITAIGKILAKINKFDLVQKRREKEQLAYLQNKKHLTEANLESISGLYIYPCSENFEVIYHTKLSLKQAKRFHELVTKINRQ